MCFNRRMNGLEPAFQRAPAISLRNLPIQFLHMAIPAAALLTAIQNPSAGGR